MYAIKRIQIGSPVYFVNIGQTTTLPTGYDFLWPDYPSDKVLAEDNISLRDKTTAETEAELLEALREQKIQELKTEALRRFQIVNNEIDSWGMVELIYMIWVSILPAARSPTTNMQSLIDIYNAAKTAYNWIMNPARTYAELEAADPVNDPSWPL